MKKGQPIKFAHPTEEDFGILCVCAIRYCHGRETYMPSMIQDIVIKHLQSIPDKDLHVLIEDCEFQRRYNLYGNDKIDKPGWIAYEKKLNDELIRRTQDEKTR